MVRAHHQLTVVGVALLAWPGQSEASSGSFYGTVACEGDCGIEAGDWIQIIANRDRHEVAVGIGESEEGELFFNFSGRPGTYRAFFLDDRDGVWRSNEVQVYLGTTRGALEFVPDQRLTEEEAQASIPYAVEIRPIDDSPWRELLCLEDAPRMAVEESTDGKADSVGTGGGGGCSASSQAGGKLGAILLGFAVLVAYRRRGPGRERAGVF